MVDGTETNGEWWGEHEGLGASAPTAVDGGVDAVGGEGAVKEKPWPNLGAGTKVRGFSQRTERKRGKR